MNALLVRNVYNALYEVFDVRWFMFFETCNGVVIRQLACRLQMGLEE